MKVPVVPFKTPPTDAVSHGGWHLSSPEGDSPLPPELSHWDYQTTLSLAAAVSVDRSRILHECALGPSTALRIMVTARSTHTRSEHTVADLLVPTQETFDLAVEVELAGNDLGGRLTLETFLVVSNAKPMDDLSPFRPGSILWRSKQRTHLEGNRAQFPTDAADFRTTHPRSPDAAWELRIDLTDEEALFLSAARLTLNAANEAVARLLSGAKDESTSQLRRTLSWDVTRQMVDVAMGSDHILGLDFDPEAITVGGVLRNLLAQIWPQESTLTVRKWWLEDRSRIETHLQHHCGLLP